jgi:hypothetical protein
MKQLAIATLLALGLTLGACGGGNSNSSNAINGNWTATLTNLDGTEAFAFTVTLSQGNGTLVNVSNFSLTTEEPCFGTAGSETGSFTLTSNVSQNITGSFQMTIQSTNPSGNVLTLNGTLSNSTIGGTWSLSGPGCTGGGNFSVSTM